MVAVLREPAMSPTRRSAKLLVDRIPRSPSTALNRLLRRNSHEAAGGSLRGYERVTVCPAEIVNTLGAAEILRASGAFAEVIELAAGGLLLRATDESAAWTHEAVRRAFEAVRPALPPGQPCQLQFDTTTNVVMIDARAGR
jgi:hypothetical protein